MKKLLVVLFACVSLKSLSQISLGPIAQFNYSAINGEINSPTFKPGFGFGIGSDLKLDEKLIIEPSVVYTTQNTSFGTDSIGDFDLKLSYITVPVMLKFFANESLNLQMGFQSSFLTSSDLKQNQVSYPLKKEFNNFDFGLNFGIGYYITESFQFNLRYSISMTDLNKSALPTDTFYNRSIKLNLNYFFQLQKTKKEIQKE